jgi:hypothetical protein
MASPLPSLCRGHSAHDDVDGDRVSERIRDENVIKLRSEEFECAFTDEQQRLVQDPLVFGCGMNLE